MSQESNLRDDAVRAETERCAQICEAMLAGGRAWTPSLPAEKALLEAAANIRKETP